MAKKLMSLLAATAVIGGAGPMVFSQDGARPQKASENTLMVQDKNYPLPHALAYEDDDRRRGKWSWWF